MVPLREEDAAVVVVAVGVEDVVVMWALGVGVTCSVGVVVTLIVRGGDEDTPSGEARKKLKDSGSQEIPEEECETFWACTTEVAWVEEEE